MQGAVDTEHEAGPAPPPALTADMALLLDFDGTLAPLAPQPQAVQRDPALVDLLTRLFNRLGGAMGLVTGRQLEVVDELLAPLKLPGAGLHGAQLRRRGQDEAPLELATGIELVHSELQRHFGDDPRIVIENKTVAVALHYRLAPERRGECAAVLGRLAGAAGLKLIHGHCVVEARPAGVDKGQGLRRLMQQPPFAGRRPIFLGDDRTDEDAMAAALELGGHAVKVGAGDSIAPHRLNDVAAVHAWLRAGLALPQQSP